MGSYLSNNFTNCVKFTHFYTLLGKSLPKYVGYLGNFLPDHYTKCVILTQSYTYLGKSLPKYVEYLGNYLPGHFTKYVKPTHTQVLHILHIVLSKYCANIYPYCVQVNFYSSCEIFNCPNVSCDNCMFVIVAIYALFWVKSWPQKLRSCKIFDKYHVCLRTRFSPV